MKQTKTCISCRRPITNDAGSTSFSCPACGKYEVIRCSHCRTIAAQYKCPACSFIGPN